MRKVAIFLLILPVLAFGGCNLAERLYALQALPDGTEAWFVTHADNQTFGFGPGGNEPASALNAPGSFYAGGLAVMVVIDPNAQRASVFSAG